MKWKGSYTIEAAVIMSTFCLITVTLIHNVYRLHDETRGMMVLHETIEKARQNDFISDGGTAGGEGIKELEVWGKERYGFAWSFENFQIALKQQGDKITGTADGGNWKGEIETQIFRPQDFLRKTEAVKQLGVTDGN